MRSGDEQPRARERHDFRELGLRPGAVVLAVRAPEHAFVAAGEHEAARPRRHRVELLEQEASGIAQRQPRVDARRRPRGVRAPRVEPGDAAVMGRGVHRALVKGEAPAASGLPAASERDPTLGGVLTAAQLPPPGALSGIVATGRRGSGPKERARPVALDREHADVLSGERLGVAEGLRRAAFARKPNAAAGLSCDSDVASAERIDRDRDRVEATRLLRCDQDLDEGRALVQSDLEKTDIRSEQQRRLVTLHAPGNVVDGELRLAQRLRVPALTRVEGHVQPRAAGDGGEDRYVPRELGMTLDSAHGLAGEACDGLPACRVVERAKDLVARAYVPGARLK